MLAAVENYKGIKFIRISSLPADQKNQIWSSFNINLVIKILKDDTLLNDCLEYKHYVAWYQNIFTVNRNEKNIEAENIRKLAIAS